MASVDTDIDDCISLSHYPERKIVFSNISKTLAQNQPYVAHLEFKAGYLCAP